MQVAVKPARTELYSQSYGSIRAYDGTNLFLHAMDVGLS